MVDVLRSGMADVMEQITRAGTVPVLLTGDNQRAAKSIADQLHIADVKA